MQRVVKLAKLPYKVMVDKQTDFGSSIMINDKGRGSHSQANSSQNKSNKYELISCGDYNSYAVVNI